MAGLPGVNKERGIVLVFVLIFIFVLSLLTTGAFQSAVLEMKMAKNYQKGLL